MREKLIELLGYIQARGEDFTDCEIYGMRVPDTVSNEDVASHLIAHGVTVQEWIPASEPPKEKGRYLCNVKSFAFPGCFYRAILHYDKHGFREGNIYTDDVTHWMPLPQPPKEG